MCNPYEKLTREEVAEKYDKCLNNERELIQNMTLLLRSLAGASVTDEELLEKQNRMLQFMQLYHLNASVTEDVRDVHLRNLQF